MCIKVMKTILKKDGSPNECHLCGWDVVVLIDLSPYWDPGVHIHVCKECLRKALEKSIREECLQEVLVKSTPKPLKHLPDKKGEVDEGRENTARI